MEDEKESTDAGGFGDLVPGGCNLYWTLGQLKDVDALGSTLNQVKDVDVLGGTLGPGQTLVHLSSTGPSPGFVIGSIFSVSFLRFALI